MVNTCTVTGKAGRRGAPQADPRPASGQPRRAGCWLPGCYAELDADALRAIDGVDHVFGNRDKPSIGRILDDLGIDSRGRSYLSHGTIALSASRADGGCDPSASVPGAVHFGERSRAFLKIQEGCDLVCSYCIIPKVRGRSRSVPQTRVLDAFRALRTGGYHEVVLTGVNTGDYGRDLEPRTDLASLLRSLLGACGPDRIRLNSLEPRTVTDEILELMAEDPRLAPHLQVPLQSGSDTILRRMRRNYRARDYIERLRTIRNRVPSVGLGADVIVGFPGETDEHFEDTVRTIEAASLNYLHVFSWSPRPGTPAADLADRPHGSTVRARARRLCELADRLGREFRTGLVGEVIDAVILGPGAPGQPLRALTGNFVEVELPPARIEPGCLVPVRILSVDGDSTRAEPVA